MEESFQNQTPHSQVAPKNWLVESILVTLFCCMPFGIAGIVFASQVNSRFALGDYAGALQASRNAAKWTKIGFGIGIAVIIASVIFSSFFGGLAYWNTMRNND